MRDTKQISSLHQPSWPQGASDRGWKLILFSPWQNSATRATERAISCFYTSAQEKGNKWIRKWRASGFLKLMKEKDSKKLVCGSFCPRTSVTPLFLLELCRVSHFSHLPPHCPCSMSDSLQKGLGPFRSCVFGVRKHWGTEKRGIPFVHFQGLPRLLYHHCPHPSSGIRVYTSVPAKEHPGLWREVFWVLQSQKSVVNLVIYAILKRNTFLSRA